jgi:cytochrome c oxidase subunit 4
MNAATTFRSAVLKLSGVWLMLILLMLLSLGSAYLSLGAGNCIAGLLIAALKSALVLTFFMRLGNTPALIRIVIATAALALLLLFTLSGVDYATRIIYRAPWQTPLQRPAPDLDRHAANVSQRPTS